MKSLVVYDSIFGNTKQIAQALAEGLGTVSQVDLFYIKDINMATFKQYQLIMIGSPTRGFKPTTEIETFLKSLPKNELEGISICSFDTRILLSTIKSKAFRWIVKTGGYAAKTISRLLQKKGGYLIGEPMGFYVTGEQGPLADDELIRAKNWAIELIHQID